MLMSRSERLYEYFDLNFTRKRRPPHVYTSRHCNLSMCLIVTAQLDYFFGTYFSCMAVRTRVRPFCSRADVVKVSISFFKHNFCGYRKYPYLLLLENWTLRW